MNKDLVTHWPPIHQRLRIPSQVGFDLRQTANDKIYDDINWQVPDISTHAVLNKDANMKVNPCPNFETIKSLF